MTRLRLIAAALLLPALAACETELVTQPLATGAIPEIMVVTDSATWNGVVGDAVRATLAQPIATLPNQQGAFRLRLQPLASNLLPGIQKTRNVLFIAPLSDSTDIARYLRARVPEGQRAAIEAGQGVAVTVRPDLWAQNQIVVLATAATDTLLARAIADRGADLRERFNALALQATVAEMFDVGRQSGEEDTLLLKHDFAVAVQHDYVRVQDTTLSVDGKPSGFVRYRRVIPQTWRDFFVFYQEGVTEMPTEAKLDRMTADLLETFARGEEDASFVAMDFRRPVVTDTVDVGGRETLQTRGMWRMTEDLMGGAFIRNAWLDPDADRLYVYFGMTFAPSRTHDKREFLRQMEAIATTFRTPTTGEGA